MHLTQAVPLKDAPLTQLYYEVIKGLVKKEKSIFYTVHVYQL